MKSAVAAILLAAFSLSLTGCIVEGPGRPGWCYYHPYRCQ